MIFSKSRDKVELHKDLKVNEVKIKRVFNFKYLGLTFDPHLTFDIHFRIIQSKLACILGRIRRVSKFLPLDVFKIVFKAYVIPTYDYCIDVWATKSHNELCKAQAAINRFLFAVYQPSLYRKARKRFKKEAKESSRQVYSKQKLMEVNSFLEQLNILTIPERADWTRAKNVLKFVKSQVPSLSSVYEFSQRASSMTFPRLQVSRSNSESIRKSVKFKSIASWNSLPKTWNLDDLSSSQFKKAVHDHIVTKRKNQFVSL